MTAAVEELQELAERLAKAADYTVIFTDAATVRTTYLKLVGVVHPDRNGDDEMAKEAFQRLEKFYADAQKALAEDRFGEPVVTIRTKRGVHEVKRRVGAGDIAALYQTATTTVHAGGSGTAIGLLKVARSARDNDLMAAEAKALKALHATDDKLTRHYPLLLDSFLYKDGRRRANVMTHQDGIDLQRLRPAFLSGLDPRHVTWMWRRILMALGFAHDHGFLHGAVLPPHILILPEDHGVILLDWCYSVPMTVSDPKSKTPPVRALVNDCRAWYPEEVTKKEPPSPATDIVMAARTMVWLLGGVPTTGVMPNWVPQKMRAFFKGCLAVPQAMRPQNAWNLLGEFDEVLHRIGEPFYPRRFVEFTVPPGTA